MTKNYSLSAVVLSRNSEKKIAKCLSSLEGWADEIIIVDGGSTDNTLKIAEQYGAKVYVHQFSGSFAQERNFGTDKTSRTWVLQLDSDEVLTDSFKEKCGEVLPNASFAAFKFRRKNVFLGHEFKYGGWYHWSQHLFKKGRARYEGRVHEKMIVDGETGYLDADILHVPFDSIAEFVERQNRYTDLQAADIIDTEKDLSLKKVRYNLKIKPLKLFKKIYFNKRAYKEGFYGLVFALLSSWVHFLKWAKVWERVRLKKNILVIRNDRFGEFLLNVPAIRALKNTFKDSKIILALDGQVKGLAGLVEGIDEIITWKNGRHSLAEIIKFSNLLRKKNIDMALVMNPSKDSNIAVYLAGIPERIGYSRKWGFLLTKKALDLKHFEKKHEVEYNLDLARLAGADTVDKGLALKVPGTFREENVIVIHPWTSDPVKQWPMERFRELALKIAKESDSEVLIIGGKEESHKSGLFNNLSNRVKNLTGRTSLVELASILKKCKLLISGDSGPVHLACAVGTGVIALFRNDIPGKGPRRWGPWGEGNIVIEKKSLSDITVDEVFDKVRQWKNSSSSILSV